MCMGCPFFLEEALGERVAWPFTFGGNIARNFFAHSTGQKSESTSINLW